ncbi:MAG: AHH domain-containing protein [Candidatus Electrothrix aestuarii]|uniref:AHH domain-containing protein n=1 Tax=Candidatus Electrothrix aestuarii TaxID=3062594 RepID=A0AAU8M183_9BACT|nr:AHH domain-containing protein [Candidatus Electrothrix aestuarii]
MLSSKRADYRATSPIIHRPGNTAAHHIVGNGALSTRAREILKKFNIDPNSPLNGVYLPRQAGAAEGSLHTGRHLNISIEEVNHRIAHLDSREAVLSELAQIKLDLLTRSLPLQRIDL